MDHLIQICPTMTTMTRLNSARIASMMEPLHGGRCVSNVATFHRRAFVEIFPVSGNVGVIDKMAAECESSIQAKNASFGIAALSISKKMSLPDTGKVAVSV